MVSMLAVINPIRTVGPDKTRHFRTLLGLEALAGVSRSMKAKLSMMLPM